MLLEQVTANIRHWLQGRYPGIDMVLLVGGAAAVIAFILAKLLKPPKT